MTDERADVPVPAEVWAVRVTAPDGSEHVIHSREEWEALRAQYEPSDTDDVPARLTP